MCRLSSSLCIYWVVCEYLWAYSLYVWMCVSVILAPGRQAGGCRGNPQLATQRITQLQCLTPARCPTQTHNLLNGIRCMRLTGPSATRAKTLPWNSSHCIRTSVLLSHYLCVSEWVYVYVSLYARAAADVWQMPFSAAIRLDGERKFSFSRFLSNCAPRPLCSFPFKCFIDFT